MQKYQVIIQFDMDDDFMSHVPEHREYINRLIEEGTIDHYAVSMESRHSWITVSANDKEEVIRMLSQSPLYKYWTYEINELFVVDGLHYRLPAVQLN